MKNIKYKSPYISKKFSNNRVKWEHLYPSEKDVFEFLFKKYTPKSILDIGCACGGLGHILSKKLPNSSYTGIEINDNAAGEAKKYFKKIHNIDFMNFKSNLKYDLCISLSCIDWQNNFDKMFLKAWEYVSNNGYLFLTARLTNEKSLKNLKESFQYINYSKQGEKAPYVVINKFEILSKISNLMPEYVYISGYDGKPSNTAITPYKKIFFCGIAIKKSKNKSSKTFFDIPNSFFL